MSPSTLPRAVVGSLATLVVVALGATPAGAAAGTIPLSPAEVVVQLVPLENYEASSEEDPYGAVEVEWGGAVDLRLPAAVDASAATYLLETGAETDPEPTRTLSSEDPGAGHLDVTDGPDGDVRISLPTDDSSGPLGLLTVDGLTGTQPGIEVGGPLVYLFTSTGSGTSVVPVEPELSSYAGLPCTLSWLAVEPEPGADDEAGCAPYAVTAGTTVELTLPPDSLLRAVGVDALTDVSASLVAIESGSEPDDGAHDGFDDGYVDGYAAGEQAGPAAEHVPGRGPSYDAAQAATDTGYDAGYEDGHLYGWSQATEPVTDPDPETDPDADSSTWSWFFGSTTGEEPLPDVPLTESSSASVLARVTEVARALDDTSTADAYPAEEPAVEEEELEEPYHVDDLPVTATAAGVELAVPADAPAGEHELVLAVGSDSTVPAAVLYLTLDVTAAPVAVAPVAPVVALPGQPSVAPVSNQGLASNTGWTEPAPAGHSTLLVAVGGGALLVAGVGAVAVLRPRRRPVAPALD
jgi:hypothetical protein